MHYADRIAELEQQQRDDPGYDARARAAHGMTLPQQIAYYQKEWREEAERVALGARDRQAQQWMESNFTSLTHYRRYVEGLEQLMLRFCHEEQRAPHWGVSSFLRELVEEQPVLFADLRQLMAQEVSYG